MSAIVLSVSKQVNEWEDFVMYHYNIFSKPMNVLSANSQADPIDFNISEVNCVEYTEPAYARSYLKTRLGWLVERINNDRRVRVLYTSIDTSSKKDPRIYFCIKPGSDLQLENIDEYLTAAMQECVMETFKY